MEDPEAPEPPLHRAARLGDVHEVARLVSEGVDIDARAFAQSLTPLMVAARSTDAETKQVVEWLLTHGADPTLTSTHELGATAAWYAAGSTGQADQVDRLKLLLDAGLDPNETGEERESLLYMACQTGDIARVRLLLERGAMASINGMSDIRSSWEIPLFAAAESGSIECVQLLLEAGADVHLRTGTIEEDPEYEDEGETALGRAASPEIARLLIAAGADVNAPDWYYDDVLGRALNMANKQVALGNPYAFAVADLLLQEGAVLNKTLRDYGPRLYYAAFDHQATVVEYLLQHGASREPTRDGSTALHAACWPKESEVCERIIRTLVGVGFSTDQRNDEGQAPLHEATGGHWPNYTVTRVLLELGAEPDPINQYGQTPLHIAVIWGSQDCIRILLKGGADPHIKDDEGKTPIDYFDEYKEEGTSLLDLQQ